MVQAHMILAVVPQMGMSEHLKTHSGCRDPSYLFSRNRNSQKKEPGFCRALQEIIIKEVLKATIERRKKGGVFVAFKENIS